MKLKPLRFIGHKIGPFDHIELNWEKESRHTLIVAENGMGKTTLVTAIASCLSVGSNDFFPVEHFERFAHNQESTAYLEIELDGQIEWVLRCPLAKDDQKTEQLLEQYIGNVQGIVLDSDFNRGDARRGAIRAVVSKGWLSLLRTWQSGKQIEWLSAAYGISRDIHQISPKKNDWNLQPEHPLKDNLNPFSSIQSNEISQWIKDQKVNHALAIAEGRENEAEAYLQAIKRVENLFTENLGIPISFQVMRNPLRLEVQQNGSVLTMAQLSDGTRNLLSWMLDYLMKASRISWKNPTDAVLAPGLVLVDEIDSHLHPKWQRQIMPLISQLLPETHIIATTHSPFVLGSTDDAQVFQIYKDGNGKLQVKAGFDELYGYPADLVLQKSFVPSLYPPEIEQKLQQLSALARENAAGTLSPLKKAEHDALLKELATINPWLNNLMSLSQTRGMPA